MNICWSKQTNCYPLRDVPNDFDVYYKLNFSLITLLPTFTQLILYTLIIIWARDDSIQSTWNTI